MKTNSKRQLTLHKLEALAKSTTHPPEAQAARDNIEDLKVHTVHVQVAPVSIGRNDHGTVEIGHYFRRGWQHRGYMR